MEATAIRHDKAPRPSIDQFYEEGRKFIQMMKDTGKDPCHAITPADDEWAEWGAYFVSRYGEPPEAFRAVERGEYGEKGSFTVPALQPEWFDREWVPRSVSYKPARRHRALGAQTDEEREMADRLVAVFKRGRSKNPEKIL